LVGGHILSREWLPPKALKQRLDISRREVVLGETHIFKITVLLKDLFETSAYSCAGKIIMAQVDHFKRFVLLGAGLRTEVLSDLGKVVIIQARVTEEKYLQALGISNDLSEGADGSFISGLPQLVFIGADGARLKGIRIHGVPVQKQILNWAVIVGQNGRQLCNLVVSQTIVREL